MSTSNEQQKGPGDRIDRLKKRLQRIADDDAKEGVKDPMIHVVRGILDFLTDRYPR